MDESLGDEEDEEEDFDNPGIMLANDKVGDGNDDLNTAASGVFEAWMNDSPKFDDYLFEGAKPLVRNKTNGRVIFGELVSKFDTRDPYNISIKVQILHNQTALLDIQIYTTLSPKHAS